MYNEQSQREREGERERERILKNTTNSCYRKTRVRTTNASLRTNYQNQKKLNHECNYMKQHKAKQTSKRSLRKLRENAATKLW